MLTPNNMPAELQAYYDDPSLEGWVMPYTLGSGYNPSLQSGLQEYNEEPTVAAIHDSLAVKDRSFISQFRDLHQRGFITPETLFLPTARTAIPCADAIRGFVGELYDFEPAINYVILNRNSNRYVWNGDDSPGQAEISRLAELIPGYAHIVILDEIVFLGNTLKYATHLVFEALRKVATHRPHVLLTPGDWYSEMQSRTLEDMGMYGGDYIDYEKVTLAPMAAKMNLAGIAAARAVLSNNPDSAHDIFHSEIIAGRK